MTKGEIETIAVKLIQAPDLPVPPKKVHELTHKMIEENTKINLTIKKVGFDGWNPVYELYNPDQQGATILAAAKAARSLKPNQHSHVPCKVM